MILGENQGCPGWCVCVLRGHAEHLDDLPLATQSELFAEVARVARAVRGVVRARTGSAPRINYECLGNVVPHVHWHVIPRHHDDPTPRAAVWGWDPHQLRGSMSDAERESWRRALAHALHDPAAGG